MRLRSAWLVAVLGIATLSGCGKPEPEPPPAPPPLSKQGLSLSSWKSPRPDLHDRLLLAHALAKGDTEAMVLVATEVGKTATVAQAIAALGGDIQTRFDDVGYLRVRLALERFAEVDALPDVLMADLDGGGAHGLYANDRDRVRYPVMGADTPQQADTRTDPFATDTLLGAEIGSPATTLAAEIETLLQAAAGQEANVIARDADGGRFPGGGSDFFALMANRAVEVHGKPWLFAAGALGRVEGVTGASSGRRVISVGDSAMPATASLGPASDGAAKPDMLAQGGFEGAASATESLIAEARAENLPADARHITWALRMGARRLDDHPSHEQGFGVLDTTRAKELLEQVQARSFDLPDIQTRAPVKTYVSRFLPEAGVGQGLYEREGWLIRQKDTRTITLLRQSGAPTPLAYSLQWRGNDGTFKTARDEVTLPLHEPVQLELEISPQQVGIHSAHLYLIDKASELPVHAVMTTIVAAEPFTAANRYRIEHREQMRGKQPKRYFLDVPPNISSLRVDAAVRAGRVQLMLTGGALALPPSKVIAAGQPAVLLVAYPPPGVYELTILPTHTPVDDLQISASTYYVDSQLDEKPPENNSTLLWMNNIYAPVQRSDILTEIGARRVLKDAGGPSGMRAYNIAVEPDSSSLRVAVTPADGRTRMGLYLYDCATGSCKLWGSDVFTRPAAKALVVPNPRAGLWRVVVDATAPGTAFEYTQIVSHPRFGRGSVAGESVERRTGARWNQQVSYQVSAAPPFGYDLVGLMDVVDPGSEAEERAAPFSDWQAGEDGRDLPLRPLRLSTQVMRLEVEAARSSTAPPR
ncbi:hypothetical protein JM946_24490 [Steroidobacter sp. S1-65]|uniref:Uncharacterized protein n=1 Tax=Steroidobacter gossypii TaxID=2805490 RepID=A0ABS1X3W8_9GAMM|nr:hypothetical protein [Steroidobacter gossypii]MBM0107905.1 hypothetical protein [Steroidobacter gossypii]